jgi:hypothetical protein
LARKIRPKKEIKTRRQKTKPKPKPKKKPI